MSLSGLDETSKLVEEKLDMLNVNVNKFYETRATPPASAKPRKRKRGIGGKGPQTERMKRQLRQFANFLMKNGYDGDMSKLRSSARRFWLANTASMDKAASSKGQEKGYSNYRVLADSYKAMLVVYNSFCKLIFYGKEDGDNFLN